MILFKNAYSIGKFCYYFYEEAKDILFENRLDGYSNYYQYEFSYFIDGNYSDLTDVQCANSIQKHKVANDII